MLDDILWFPRLKKIHPLDGPLDRLEQYQAKNLPIFHCSMRTHVSLKAGWASKSRIGTVRVGSPTAVECDQFAELQN